MQKFNSQKDSFLKRLNTSQHLRPLQKCGGDRARWSILLDYSSNQYFVLIGSPLVVRYDNTTWIGFDNMQAAQGLCKN